jgi:hypothetical protein
VIASPKAPSIAVAMHEEPTAALSVMPAARISDRGREKVTPASNSVGRDENDSLSQDFAAQSTRLARTDMIVK